MKPAVFTAIAFSVIIGCTDPISPGESSLVYVDVQHDFRGDLVQVWINQKLVAEQEATTNSLISLAWSKAVAGLPKGSHKVAVRLPNLFVADSTVFVVRDSTHLCIDYERDVRRLRFSTFYGRSMRD